MLHTFATACHLYDARDPTPGFSSDLAKITLADDGKAAYTLTVAGSTWRPDYDNPTFDSETPVVASFKWTKGGKIPDLEAWRKAVEQAEQEAEQDEARRWFEHYRPDPNTIPRSNAQAETDTVSGQIDDLTVWAESNGHEIVTVCEDEAVSGKLPAAERPGLACILDVVEEGEADAVLVRSLDRLARELTVQEATLALVWKLGGRVFSVTGEIMADDPDDPMRTAMRQMAGVFAQLDRAQISKRLRDGRRRKAEAGGYIGGAPSFGTRADSTTRELVADPQETETLDRILAMREEGMAYGAIAKALNDDGIPTKRNGKWHASTVSRIADPRARARANADAALYRSRRSG